MLQQATGSGAQRVVTTLNRLSPFSEESSDERGTPTLYQYDARGNLLKMVEAANTPEARLTEYSYDSLGQRLTTTRRANAPSAPTGFGATLNIGVSVPNSNPLDPLGGDATTTITYDQYGNVTSVTDPEGNVTQHTAFDVMGNLRTRTDARGIQSERVYDALGRMTRLTEASGSNGATPEARTLAYTYDKTGLRKTMTDARGHTSSYQYDALKRMTGMTQPPLTQPELSASPNPQALASTRTDYDAEGRKLRDIDPDGIATRYSFDIDGRPTGSLDAAGNITQFLYGSVAGTGLPTPGVQAGLEGLLAAVIYPTYREDYRYDVRNRQTQVIQYLATNPNANPTAATTRYTSTTEYDAVGNPTRRTDPKGSVTTTEYDRLNRAVKITDPLGGITQFTYDRKDNLTTVTDPKGSITQYHYDRANRKTAEIRPLGDKTTYRYDQNNNLTETTSANGNKRAYVYDPLNRRTQETHFLGTGATPGSTPITSALINQALSANPPTLATGTAQPGTPTALASRSISYVYDKSGNLTSWTDKQATSSAASNAADPNHAATSANADVLSGSFSYDELNRQTRTGTTYNATNGTTQTNPTGTANAFTKTSTQSYSAAGRLKTRTDADGKSHTLSYDGAGRVNQLALPATAGNITFPQYQWNQIQEIQFPSGVKQTYAYDALMRPTEIKVTPPATGPNAPANQSPLMLFGYQYDEVSNPTQIARAFQSSSTNPPNPANPNPNGIDATQTNYGYDRLYRLTNVIPNPVTSATPTEQYAYDLVHNRLAEQKSNHPSGLITGTSVGRAFSYNANHQLAGIAQLIQSINPANQTDPNALPTNSIGATLENRNYSADGHTKEVSPTNTANGTNTNNQNTGATVDQTRTYLYDASERLVEVKTGAAGNQTVATYRYDPFGRRIRKTVTIPNTTITAQNPIAQQAGTIFFGYASEGLIAEFKDNGDFKLSYAYTPALASGSHGTWQTGPLYKRDTDLNADQIHVLHNDHLGTPQTITAINSTSATNSLVIGKPTWRASYESFGAAAIDQTIVNVANIANQSATENNHRFPGQLFDQETGLAQNYMRDYERGLGRYTQSDPLGALVSPSLFAYAAASPTKVTDRLGLCDSIEEIDRYRKMKIHPRHLVDKFNLLTIPKYEWEFECGLKSEPPDDRDRGKGVGSRFECKLCSTYVGYTELFVEIYEQIFDRFVEIRKRVCTHCNCDANSGCTDWRFAGIEDWESETVRQRLPGSRYVKVDGQPCIPALGIGQGPASKR
jgi:RHS repeat-associated protein